MYKPFSLRPAFNVTQMFMGGYEGAVYNAAFPNSLWQDTSATTPCDAVGEPIGREDSLILPAINATQGTASAKPTLGRIPRGGRRNQLVGTATMATQNVTTRAVEYTLSIQGTGTVTLSGTSTAGPLVGTGAGNRVTLTFTPTAGTLTLTVSGSVTRAQLQFGAAFDAYQEVGAIYDVTEEGVPSILMPYYDGGDWFTTSVQSFGTASLFAGAGQSWWVAGAFSVFASAPHNLIAKCGATLGDRTFQFVANGVIDRLGWTVRGNNFDTTAIPVADGALHVWLLVWDGATLSLYADNAAVVVIAVGTAAEESENIVIGARTESAPAAYTTGFSEIVSFGDRALSATEIAQLRADLNSYYRGA